MIQEAFRPILEELEAGRSAVLHRTVDGVEAGEYTRSVLLPFEPIEKALQVLEKNELAVQENGRWHLTPRGFMLSNPMLVKLVEEQQKSKPLAQKT